MSVVVVLGLSCERPLVFGSGSVEVKPIFGEKKIERQVGRVKYFTFYVKKLLGNCLILVGEKRPRNLIA